ncbi:hypothetical protein H1R20_g15965, partial [Candolleomyces eurysporus]
MASKRYPYPPATPAGTFDASAAAASRASRQANVVSSEPTTLVGASRRSVSDGAEHDLGATVEQIAAVSHASYAQPPIIPQLFDGPEEQNELLRSRESDDGLSDDDMSVDSEESFDSAVSGDIEMLDSKTSLVLGSGIQAQDDPSPGPMTSYTEAVTLPCPSSRTEWSASELRAHVLQGSPRASHSAFAECSQKPQDTFSKSDGYSYQRPQTPRLCIVCKQKPPYSKNGKSYPTCGLTCAAELEKEMEREAWESVRPSSYPGFCVVCHARPKHVNASSGHVYPTCGLRCAAKYDPVKSSAGMCAVCKKRLKLATGTGNYCSIACEDKAKATLADGMGFLSLRYPTTNSPQW